MNAHVHTFTVEITIRVTCAKPVDRETAEARIVRHYGRFSGMGNRPDTGIVLVEEVGDWTVREDAP